jgi:hypothetical protein
MGFARRTPDVHDLILVPLVLWGGMVFSVLAAAGIGCRAMAALGEGRPGPDWLMPAVAVVVLLSSSLQTWLFFQLADRRLFPRVFEAQQRLAGRGPDDAILHLRLTLQFLGWGISVLEAVLGMGVSLLGGGYLPIFLFGGGALAALLATFPRRSGPWGSVTQLDRWRARLSAKSIGYSSI